MNFLDLISNYSELDESDEQEATMFNKVLAYYHLYDFKKITVEYLEKIKDNDIENINNPNNFIYSLHNIFPNKNIQNILNLSPERIEMSKNNILILDQNQDNINININILENELDNYINNINKNTNNNTNNINIFKVFYGTKFYHKELIVLCIEYKSLLKKIIILDVFENEFKTSKHNFILNITSEPINIDNLNEPHNFIEQKILIQPKPNLEQIKNVINNEINKLI